MKLNPSTTPMTHGVNVEIMSMASAYRAGEPPMRTFTGARASATGATLSRRSCTASMAAPLVTSALTASSTTARSPAGAAS